ncbi:D-cysteine desulfhydrase [Roseobacter sp. AzwK-3b]|nr:D-cysteine desulfhydrase [Roseobacter sp. AzwK-3b]
MGRAATALNGGCVTHERTYVTDVASHSTLREWWHHLRQPIALALMTGVAIVLTLMGPFGTGNSLRPVPRLAFWMSITTSTYAVGCFVAIRLGAMWPADRPVGMRIALTAVLTGLGVTATVMLINWAALGQRPDSIPLPATVFGIAFIVSIMFDLLRTRHDPPAAPAPSVTPQATGPAILDRLPVERRGALLALSAEDHYVRVHTDRGAALCLLRLSDAIRETGDIPGLQVHRSHWVARPAIAATRRNGDKAVIRLTDGTELPVSRRYVPILKEAGLLPRASHG